MFSLESEFAILLQKMGVLRPGQGLDGRSYGPITGYRLGEAPGGSSYDDEEGDFSGIEEDGTHGYFPIPPGSEGPIESEPIDPQIWWERFVDSLTVIPSPNQFTYNGRTQLLLYTVPTSMATETYEDSNGDFYVKDEWGNPIKLTYSRLSEPTLPSNALVDGLLETVTTDAGTFYVTTDYVGTWSSQHVYIRIEDSGEFRQVDPAAAFYYDGNYLISDTIYPYDLETRYETIYLDDGTSFWLDNWGNLYARPTMDWYPEVWPMPETGGVVYGPAPRVDANALFDLADAIEEEENENILRLNGEGWPNPDPSEGPVTVDPWFIRDLPPEGSEPLPPEEDPGGVIRKGYTIIPTGGVAIRTAFGTQGDDLIDTGGWVLADLGNDTLIGNNGRDTLIGGGGNDSLNGGLGNDILSGEAGADTLIGGDGNDLLDGGQGDDLLRGGAGVNNFIGDDGFDTVSYEDVGGVLVNLGDGSTGGDAEGDTFTGVEAIVGSTYDDILVGHMGTNRLVGNGGNDLLEGGGGADTLQGGTGADTLIGGDGADTADYSDAATGVIVNLANGATGGDAAGDVLSGIENLTGSAHADLLTGDGGDNTFIGNGGVDTMEGGEGSDTISYANSASGVMIDLGAGATGGLVLTSIENLIGSGHDDHLAGDAAANILSGGLGADTLLGGAGDDRLEGGNGGDFLVGGAGADTLQGGAGWDVLSYQGSASGVVVNLALGIGNGGDAGGDRFEGIEAVSGSSFGDHLIGDAGKNNLFGAEGNDLLEGHGGDDFLVGEEGDDTLVGGGGSDTLIGGQGIDVASYQTASGAVIVNLATGSTSGEAAGDRLFDIENLSGSNHDDQLTGDAGANTLSGRDGADLLDGGEGDDILIGGDGADTLVGGSGWDTASYAGSTSGVTVSLATGNAEGDVFSGIEGLAGTEFDDHLTGDAASNVLAGAGGADVLDGGDGNDALYGGDSHDTLIGGAGDDALNGDDGNDFLDGGFGNDTVSGGAGSDVLTTGYGNDVLDGGDGNDTLVGGYGNDTLSGGAGANALDGGAGFDVASYANASAGVVVSLAPGAKALQADSFTGIEGLLGSSHADRLTGDANGNLLEGNAGDDTLEGGDGADTLAGGAGLDTASYADAASGVAASLVDGGTVGAAAGDVFESIENLSGSAHGDQLTGDGGGNVLSGQAGDDLLDGDAGNDTLDGGLGNDTLVGGLGADAFIGGDGFDVVSYEGAASGVVVTLVYGGASGEANGDTFSGIEAVSGSTYNDVLKGNAAANTLAGNGGHDLLDGGAGSDTLQGGAGDDTLIGGAGADMLVGGAGWDTATYQDAQAGVVASLAVGGTGGDAAGDTFVGVEALVGSSYDDRLTGDDVANVLSGAGGNDMLSGGRGNDSLDGGIGNDTLTGGDGADALTGGIGFDMASYQGAGAGVVASLASGGTGGDAAGDTFVGVEGLIGSAHGDRLTGNAGHNLLVGNGGDDVLSGGGGNDTLDGGDGFDIADYSTASVGLNLDLSGGNVGSVLISIEGLTGSAFDDVLSGNGAANLLNGGAGSDVLRGGDGNDTLTGDRGSDVFVFDTLLNGAGNVDGLTDFDFREDRIQLDSGIFAGLRSGPLDAAAFTLDKNATTADHRIIYHAETGELFYDADGTGRIEQVKFAVLVPGTVLSADLFMIA